MTQPWDNACSRYWDTAKNGLSGAACRVGPLWSCDLAMSSSWGMAHLPRGPCILSHLWNVGISSIMLVSWIYTSYCFFVSTLAPCAFEFFGKLRMLFITEYIICQRSFATEVSDIFDVHRFIDSDSYFFDSFRKGQLLLGCLGAPGLCPFGPGRRATGGSRGAGARGGGAASVIRRQRSVPI